MTLDEADAPVERAPETDGEAAPSDSPTTERSVFWVFPTLFGISLLLESIADELRYAKYLLAPAGFVLWAALARKRVHRSRTYRPYVLRFLGLFLAMIGASLVVHLGGGTLSGRFFEEATFIVSPLIFVLFAFEFFDPADRARHARLMFFFVAASYIIQAGQGLIEVALHPWLLIEGLRTSNMPTETGYLAYVLGSFFLYFHFTGERRYSLVALVLTVFAFKRLEFVALVGVLLTKGLVEHSFRRLQRLRWTVPYLALAVNAAYLALVIALVSGALDELVGELTGTSANAVTMGRVSGAFGVVEGELGGFVVWWGKGLGTVTPILQHEGTTLLNLHSDVLKNFIEFGVPLFVVWLVLFYRFHLRSLPITLLALHLNVLYMAENVFIYAGYSVVFYTLVIFLMADADEKDGATLADSSGGAGAAQERGTPSETSSP
ncbi:MAG: hypothetical protein HY906_26115 [Deltaproteobacteria bacterium]|nr:hypothetical protein [Deltaproteobacteria bacterium]